MIAKTNDLISSLKRIRTSETDIYNLEHLLVALLISDEEVTQDLMGKIVAQTITHGVLHLLDRKGAGMAELAYIEREPVCQYRLRKIFAAGIIA